MISKILTIKYKRAILSFMIVLLFFLGIVDIAIVSYQRRLLIDEAERNARHELSLMGTFIREALLRQDYVTIEQFLNQWGEEHVEVIEIEAIAPNNFILVHYKKQQAVTYSYSMQYQVRYKGKDLLTLKMVEDFTSNEKSLNRLNVQLILSSLFLTIILGIALWYTLKKMALIPLEKEISRRKAAEKKFRGLMESAPDAMALVNSEGRIIIVNGQLENLSGYPRKDLLNKNIEILIPPQFRKKYREFLKKYFAQHITNPFESGLDIYGLHHSGKTFPIDINLSPLETDEGLFALMDIRETTRRKQREEKIRRNYYFQRTMGSILKVSLEPITLEELLQRILDLILSIPFLSFQSKGCIFLVEKDSDVLVMKVHHGLDDELTSNCLTVPFGHCLCGKAASTNDIVFSATIDECHINRYKKMFPHGHYCIPIHFGHKVYGVINIVLKEGHKRNRDEEQLLIAIAHTIAGIIMRKQIENEKKRLKEQLYESEKLSALGRLTENVAHEIRNPLTSLGGFAKRLNVKLSEGTKEKEYAKVIVSEVNRLEDILKDVLTFSKKTTHHKEKYNIDTIIDASIKTFEILCNEKMISIKKLFNDDIPEILIDKEQIRQVIDNLISNAIDAMPNGGELIITTRKKTLDEIMTFLQVSVSDTGEGIAEDKLNKIFEPFFTTKAVGKKQGTGLGLPIIKKIMDEHNGFIDVESSVGKGSTFTISFPYQNEVESSKI